MDKRHNDESFFPCRKQNDNRKETEIYETDGGSLNWGYYSSTTRWLATFRSTPNDTMHPRRFGNKVRKGKGKAENDWTCRSVK